MNELIEEIVVWFSILFCVYMTIIMAVVTLIICIRLFDRFVNNKKGDRK